MKRYILILTLLIASAVPVFAQDDDDDDANEKIQDKMSEYIQKRLDLTKEETTKFAPVFLKYFREWRQTIRDNKGDKLVRQQKVIELRLRYRTQFRDIIGERRGNQVFVQQDRFIQELIEIRNQRRGNNPGNRPLNRNRTNFIIK
jgi:hypothetical protein